MEKVTGIGGLFFRAQDPAGITVAIDPQPYPNGRFARLHDPEGNPIELWGPAELDEPR